MSQIEGFMKRIQQIEESFKDSFYGSYVWPNRSREKEVIDFLGKLISLKQGVK